MNKIAVTLVSAAIITLLLIFLPFTFSPVWTAKRTVFIGERPEAIYPYLNNIEKWQEWTVWTKKEDPAMSFDYTQKLTGAGAKASWKSKKMGNGSIKFLSIERGKSVTYEMFFGTVANAITGTITVERSGLGSVVVWIQQGNFGKNIFERYMGIIMDTVVGADMEKGLWNLRSKVEKSKK